MIEKKQLIKDINKKCKIFFNESTFFLDPSSANKFESKGTYHSKAINFYKNEGAEITVIKWFSNFWVYLAIKFENNNTFISLSLFQGEEEDPSKNQLFRAEWDDYNNPEEKHPQPHWHITSNRAIENTFIELIEGDAEEGFAAQILNEEKAKIVDINKMHFAMNGNWKNNDLDVHPINNNEAIVNWFQGLFSNLKEQLQYISK